MREINNVARYLSSNDIRLHFGLGPDRTVGRIELLWPAGTWQIPTNIPANQVLVVEEP